MEKKNTERKIIILSLALFFYFIYPKTLHAYIGPGAGFAFLTSFATLFVTFLLAFISILIWPIRLLFKAIRRKKGFTKTNVNRVVIVGLDGLDPLLARKFMDEGKLPNLAKIKEQGSFTCLGTTLPAMSPVAWSSFITGVNPSKHSIFDFLSRNKQTYLPELSSSQVGKAPKAISLGKYQIPIGKPKIQLLRKSKPFWNILSEKDITSSILRVPITFPPEKFKGVLLSAMCVPDLKGTQGTFSFYTTETSEKKHTGGVQIPVKLEANKITSYIAGPENSLLKKQEEMRIPFTVTIDNEKQEAEIKIQEEKLRLKQGEYSKWIKLTFKPGLGVKVNGICRFYINEISPEFKLYVTPINIDPENPAMPISHPFFYSIYLAKMFGSFATLGLAEDTWALNERIIDEDAFLKQCYLIQEEREKMFFNALEKTKKGVCACVFDSTDRIQHMFWRYIDEGHPANRNKDTEKHRKTIEELYMKMDSLVGRVMEKIAEKDILIIMSDHGFKSFRRGINLNSWLYLNGYLALKNGNESREWFKDVDWEKTKAYALGLGGMYLNIKGREAKGIVSPGKEAEKLKKEIIQKLNGLRDEEKGEVAIQEVFDSSKIFSGPYVSNSPDLFIGYNIGYRASWDGVTGIVNHTVFDDNVKSWSGDHCIDPRLVPGVFFCNRKIDAQSPEIIDIAPTVLKLFGVEVPSYMDGKPLING